MSSLTDVFTLSLLPGALVWKALIFLEFKWFSCFALLYGFPVGYYLFSLDSSLKFAYNSGIGMTIVDNGFLFLFGLLGGGIA